MKITNKELSQAIENAATCCGNKIKMRDIKPNQHSTEMYFVNKINEALDLYDVSIAKGTRNISLNSLRETATKLDDFFELGSINTTYFPGTIYLLETAPNEYELYVEHHDLYNFTRHASAISIDGLSKLHKDNLSNNGSLIEPEPMKITL